MRFSSFRSEVGTFAMASAQGSFSLEIHWFTTTRGEKTLGFFGNFRRKGKTLGSTERLLTLVYLRQGGDDVEAYLTLNRDRGFVTGSVTTEGTAVYLVEHHPKYGQVVLKKTSRVGCPMGKSHVSLFMPPGGRSGSPPTTP